MERLGEEVVQAQEAEYRAPDACPDPPRDRRRRDGEEEQRDRAELALGLDDQGETEGERGRRDRDHEGSKARSSARSQHPALAHALLLCQAAAAVKRSVGWFIDVIVLNTTLVRQRLKARIASVLLMPWPRFFAR